MSTNKHEIIISTFYKFFNNSLCREIKDELKKFCLVNKIFGIIVMAEEGVNATVSGSKKDLDSFFRYMSDEYGFNFDNIKNSKVDYHPFRKIKVKIKKEIVTLGMPGIKGDNAGTYVSPENWDEFISRDDVVLIDTRNEYETVLGSFEGAVNPKTENFRDFPMWFKENKAKFTGKKIAMCCTGGVRCEKSTSYLKNLGFNDVYHLEGGILNYLIKLGKKTRKWYGDCFVFDQRIAVDNKIKQVFTTSCYYKDQ
ncbi:MAG: rhodanese-like domain-containing protein [Rickettsiales bacterium]